MMLSQVPSQGNFEGDLCRASMTQSTLQRLLLANNSQNEYGMVTQTYDEGDKRQSQFSFLNEHEMQAADPA